MQHKWQLGRSQINRRIDNLTDNFFLADMTRFPAINEDERLKGSSKLCCLGGQFAGISIDVKKKKFVVRPRGGSSG